jgi:DNA recombination protein RmuC
MTIIILVITVLNLVLIGYLILKKVSPKLDIEHSLREEFALSRKEFAQSTKDLRQELGLNLTQTKDSIDQRIEQLRDKNDQKLELIRKTVESKLESLQKDNSEKLEKMRLTVDEKLQSTLEKRLNQSFKIVSERLELVQRGLGEMQNLANDVGDFKRVLTNVKTRGTWGEVQLESLLEQLFIKDHYQKQISVVSGSKDLVDFAIKIPDKSSQNGFIYLPIDAKFPLEDYQRLVLAQDKADIKEIEVHKKLLINRIKAEAKTIQDKYIKPPYTTNFAILYIPIEGLYAEILRTPGLFQTLSQDFRVIISGPTTISAILNSLQLGFRTLAIAEQTSQVWELLSNIKNEFKVFGDLLDKTQDKLRQASDTIEGASKKSRTIERSLNKVELLQSSNKLKN